MYLLSMVDSNQEFVYLLNQLSKTSKLHLNQGFMFYVKDVIFIIRIHSLIYFETKALCHCGHLASLSCIISDFVEYYSLKRARLRGSLQFLNVPQFLVPSHLLPTSGAWCLASGLLVTRAQFLFLMAFNVCFIESK